jgi:D-tyrosyl-tRNA(Tyr) deacylase
MRAVIQRVSRASVTVENEIVGSIGKGLLVLVGIEVNDTMEDVDQMVAKLVRVRLFDNDGKMWYVEIKIGERMLSKFKGRYC